MNLPLITPEIAAPPHCRDMQIEMITDLFFAGASAIISDVMAMEDDA